MKLSIALPLAKAYPATLSQNLAKYTLQMTMDKGKWCWSRAERWGTSACSFKIVVLSYPWSYSGKWWLHFILSTIELSKHFFWSPPHNCDSPRGCSWWYQSLFLSCFRSLRCEPIIQRSPRGKAVMKVIDKLETMKSDIALTNVCTYLISQLYS